MKDKRKMLKSTCESSEEGTGSEGDTFHTTVCNKQRKRGRPTGNNAARERTRVQSLRSAFLDLQKTLPSVPPDTKLSKLDVLVLATTYIAHLIKTLDEGGLVSFESTQQNFHPVKKWPMRSRLYAGLAGSSNQVNAMV